MNFTCKKQATFLSYPDDNSIVGLFNDTKKVTDQTHLKCYNGELYSNVPFYIYMYKSFLDSHSKFTQILSDDMTYSKPHYLYCAGADILFKSISYLIRKQDKQESNRCNNNWNILKLLTGNSLK
jgi:hypothetical protein